MAIFSQIGDVKVTLCSKMVDSLMHPLLRPSLRIRNPSPLILYPVHVACHMSVLKVKKVPRLVKLMNTNPCKKQRNEPAILDC